MLCVGVGDREGGREIEREGGGGVHNADHSREFKGYLLTLQDGLLF